jgi:hypothetical protein
LALKKRIMLLRSMSMGDSSDIPSLSLKEDQIIEALLSWLYISVPSEAFREVIMFLLYCWVATVWNIWYSHPQVLPI